jgi:hypothetical protein
MIKQIIAIILLSILVILTMPYIQQGLQFVLSAYDWVAETLTQVFSGGQAGDLIRKLIALLTIPVAVGLVPVMIYWLARRKWFPYFMEIVWVMWLTQTAALVILFKIAA